MPIKQKQKRTSRLRYWRRLNELSQARAARMAGISRAMWALLENGLLPGEEVASKLSALFGEPPDDLQKPASPRNVLRARDGAAAYSIPASTNALPRLALPDREMLRRPARDLLRSLPLSEPHARGTPCATCDAREEAVIDTILAALRERGMG